MPLGIEFVPPWGRSWNEEEKLNNFFRRLGFNIPKPSYDYSEPWEQYSTVDEPEMGRYDASVYGALIRVAATEQSPQLSGEQFLTVLQAAMDGGQITTREWMQIEDWVHDHYFRLSPEAERMFAELDRRFQRMPLDRSLSNRVGITHQKAPVFLDGPALGNVMPLMEQLARGGSAPKRPDLLLALDSFEEAGTRVFDGKGGVHIFDLSVARGLFAMSEGPVTGLQFFQLLEAAADYGQITTAEWAEVRAWVAQNRDRMTPEALALFEATDALIRQNEKPGNKLALGQNALAEHLPAMYQLALPAPISLPSPAPGPSPLPPGPPVDNLEPPPNHLASQLDSLFGGL